MTDLPTRLERVRDAIEHARARSPHRQAVRLIGVSKRQPLEALRQARDAGLLDLGENYAQELRDKRATLDGEAPGIRWHFIGPLQSNKVKLVTGCARVHTIDRAKLLPEFDHRTPSGTAQEVLVQVNVVGEAQKAGVSPAELPELLDRFADLDRVRCCGLMLIPPRGTPAQTRPHFRALRELRDQLAKRQRPGVELRELSMGMSADYEVAIEEGATWVRVGTAIFGPRPGL